MVWNYTVSNIVCGDCLIHLYTCTASIQWRKYLQSRNDCHPRISWLLSYLFIKSILQDVTCRLCFKKVWWQQPLFYLLFLFHAFIITFIQYINSYPFAEASLLFLHCWFAKMEKPLCGAEPGFEHRPALLQASALPTETRRLYSLLWTLPFLERQNSRGSSHKSFHF